MNHISLKGRSLLTWLNFTPEEIRLFLGLAKKIKAESQRKLRRKKFSGKTLALIAVPGSALAYHSVEAAFSEEGGCISRFSPSDFSQALEWIEGRGDFARSLGSAFDAVALSGLLHDDSEVFGKFVGKPVYNLGTNRFDPLFAFASFLFIEEELGGLSGKRIAFVGPCDSPPARSLMVLSSKLGVDIALAGPQSQLPDPDFLGICRSLSAEVGSVIEVYEDPLEAVSQAHIVSTAAPSGALSSLNDVSVKNLPHPYCVDEKLMSATLNSKALFISPATVQKGRDVAFSVYEGRNSRVFFVSELRKFAIKAILSATL